MEADPENSYTLNNYSYYLSLRGEKLKAAEEYAKKAVRLDPENPNNQDTYGWVLFKMKRYEEAKFWIEKSIKNSDEPSGTVLEHMGDVLFELGEKEQALQYWKRAKEAGDTSEDIDKKIEQKKRIAE
ncbi:MAG: CDC27 family protein [Bacteroidales bacterium]|nr:CDC27 family protein [Bacteroidales bacterium]